ncbi:MAG: LuxR C-terminal-related transcriptional regulator [Candidatus Cyclobacteriaceae bacterium M3_2C_046]
MLQLISLGRNNKGIADQLHISEPTVKRIEEKTGRVMIE